MAASDRINCLRGLLCTQFLRSPNQTTALLYCRVSLQSACTHSSLRSFQPCTSRDRQLQMRRVTLLAAVLLLLQRQGVLVNAARQLQAVQCPPPALDSVKGFNLKAYIAAPWYSLEQVCLAWWCNRSW